MGGGCISREMSSAVIFFTWCGTGIRDANDPLVRDSIEVIDRVLKHDLPQGPGWRR